MVAGGSISSLLGALYLKPLDDAFSHRDRILYRRFMYDVVILAKTRWKLRRAIRLVHHFLGELKMQAHETKRFIGTTIRGFDLLGGFAHQGKHTRLTGTCPPALEREFQLRDSGEVYAGVCKEKGESGCTGSG